MTNKYFHVYVCRWPTRKISVKSKSKSLEIEQRCLTPAVFSLLPLPWLRMAMIVASLVQVDKARFNISTLINRLTLIISNPWHSNRNLEMLILWRWGNRSLQRKTRNWLQTEPTHSQCWESNPGRIRGRQVLSPLPHLCPPPHPPCHGWVCTVSFCQVSGTIAIAKMQSLCTCKTTLKPLTGNHTNAVIKGKYYKTLTVLCPYHKRGYWPSNGWWDYSWQENS